MNEKQLFDEVFRLLNKYHTVSKQPRTYCGSCNLYIGEVHALEMIGDHPGITVSEMAELMCITKGAVSQTVSKLYSKDLIVRTSAVHGGAKVSLTLTDKGRSVFEEHRLFHEKIMNNAAPVVRNCSEETGRTIEALLTAFDKALEND